MYERYVLPGTALIELKHEIQVDIASFDIVDLLTEKTLLNATTGNISPF